MSRAQKILLLGALAALAGGVCVAQRFGGGGFGGGRGGRGGGGRGGGNIGPIVRTEGGNALVDERTVRTARETATHSFGTDTPNWTNAPGFEEDVFTFTRIIYKYGTGPLISPRASRSGWINDYPDADLNLSFRIKQMTSERVDPDARTVKLTDPALFDYPFIYMVKAGRMELRDEEVPILRKYLLNGGVLMLDDFWGEQEWISVEHEISRALPEYKWIDLPMSHPLFHCVFDIKADKQKLQVPNIHAYERTGSSSSRSDPDAQEMHIRAWFDEKQHLMVIATHNTDNGDGWEREGEEHEYFRIFSENRAYPLGINIIFYSMTH